MGWGQNVDAWDGNKLGWGQNLGPWAGDKLGWGPNLGPWDGDNAQPCGWTRPGLLVLTPLPCPHPHGGVRTRPKPGLLSGADLAEHAIHPGHQVAHGAGEADAVGGAGHVQPALLAGAQQLLPGAQHLLLPAGDGLGVVPGVDGPQLRRPLLQLPDLAHQHLHVVLKGAPAPAARLRPRLAALPWPPARGGAAASPRSAPADPCSR